MAVRIHHATKKKADKLGLVLKVADNEVEVMQGERTVASAMTADKALALAIERLGLQDKPKAERSPKPPKPAKPEKVAAEEGGEDDEDGGGPEPATKSIVRKKYKTEYKARGGHCGDELAEMFKVYSTVGKGKKARTDMAAVREVAEANGVWKPEYGNLNAGQLRMSVGNRLRGLLGSGKPVKVGKQTIQPDEPAAVTKQE